MPFSERTYVNAQLSPGVRKVVASELNIKLKPQDFLEYKNIHEMASHLDLIKLNNPAEKNDITKMTVSELKKYVKPIHIESTTIATEQHKNILLTGATGFVGAYLLKELLKNFDTAIIHCLVRGKNHEDGLNRIKNGLIPITTNPDELITRVNIVLGSLDEPNLGISPETYDALSRSIDSIMHCGALVNFLYDFEHLKNTNIAGTYSVIEFASKHRLRPISYISTAGIFPSTKTYSNKIITEDMPLDFDDNIEIYGGYAQTKLVAEYAIQEAAKQGIPVSIYRLGRIGGDSITGHWPRNDFVFCFMATLHELQIAPKLDIKIDLMPVDLAAQTIATIEKAENRHNKTYHIINPKRLSISELCKQLSQTGHHIEIIDYVEWRKKLIDEIRNGHTIPLTPFIGLLPDDMSKLPRLQFDRNFDVSNVQLVLDKVGLDFPLLEASLLQRYLNQTYTK